MKGLGEYAILCCFIFIASINYSEAQRIEIKSIAIKERIIEVHYNLLDSVEGKFYSIRLYSSADGFLNPIEKIKGEVGLEVKPGLGKIVKWYFRDELPPEFSGKIAIEIRAKVFIPFISTESINQYKVFKRKRVYNLTWKGGTPQNVLNFDVYRREEKVSTFPNVANVGHHSFEFPTHLKHGKGYRFRISDTKNKEEVVFTSDFRIKRKIPILLKLATGISLGSIVYFISQSNVAESEIPDAPPPTR